MTAVFVHGVPENRRLWDGVRKHLHRTDTVALALPGFGTPVPAGFGATMNEYADWLAGELEAIARADSGPVDLVGHDWGGGFTLRVVSTRPELVRTWVCDAAGLADVDFEWHDFAKIWQTLGEGEAFFQQQLDTPPRERAAAFTMFGAPEEDALVIADAIDRRMTDCILALYRSATKVQDEWGPAVDGIDKPGLVIVPTADPFLAEAGARRTAERSGAQVAMLEEKGHWWMLQDPAAAAALLESFWASA